MTEKQCLLSSLEREIVLRQIEEVCKLRNWVNFASACRTNVHVVIGAANTPELISRLGALVAYELARGRSNGIGGQNVEAFVWTDESLQNVVQYVKEAQDAK